MTFVRQILSVFVFLCLTTTLLANISPVKQKEIQQLKDKLEAAKPLKEKAAVLTELVKLYALIDTSIAQQYLSDIQKHESSVGKAYYAFGKGLYLNQLSEYQLAKTQLLRASSLFQEKEEQVMFAKSLRELGKSYQFIGQPDSAMYFLNQAKHILEKEELTKKEQKLYADIYSVLGIVYQHHQQINYDSSLWYLNKSIQLKEEINDPSWSIEVINKAYVYFYQGDISRAAEDFLTAARQLEKTGDLKNAGVAYMNLSITHRTLRQYEEEARYIQKSLKISKKLNDRYAYAQGLLSLSTNKSAFKEYETSKKMNLEALDIAYSLDNKVLIAQALSKLGADYLELRARDSALYYLTACRTLAAQSDASSIQSAASFAAKNLGDLYLRDKQYPKAIPLLHEYLKWEAQNRGELLLQGETSEKLARAYAGIGNYQQAYHFHQQYKSLSDSLLNRENIAAITKAETESQFIAEQEKQAIALEAERKQQQLIQYSMAGGIAALSILLFLLYRNYRIKNKANQTIEAQKQQLEQLNQTKDRIFAIIGHDMRKPVLSFRGIAKKVNYLLKKQDFETLNAIGKQIEQNAQSLNKLTDNLLNWALLQRNTLTLRPQSLPLAEIIAEEVELCSGIAANKKINLQADVPHDLTVQADPHALRTILRNLIDNAIKFTPQGGKVSLSAQPDPAGIKVIVSDSGIGMDESQLQRLFLLQKNKSTKGTDGEKGTGLGMQLVKELTQLNKGNIMVDSQPQKGTTFTLTFPA
jgi:two-component system NtrC family sensor kinase